MPRVLRASVVLAAFVMIAVQPAPCRNLATPGEALVVSVDFDDGLREQYEARELLARSGLHATFYVNSGAVGDPQHMTWEQLHDLAADGNEIGGHTRLHTDLAGRTMAEDEALICDDKRALKAAGFEVTDFAYPYGSHDRQAERAAATCYASARGAGGLRREAGEGCSLAPAVESLPPADVYAIRTPGSIRGCDRAEDITAGVARAEALGGGWLHLVFHGVGPTPADACASYSTTRDALAEVLDWLAREQAAGRLRVRTTREARTGHEPRMLRRHGSGRAPAGR